MFAIIEEIGPASWLVREMDQVKMKSGVIIRTYQSGQCLTKSVPELKVMIEDARECGKALFKKGDIYYARLMFLHAFLISRLIPFFPKDQSSLLHSNVALCCLKLEEPFQALETLKAAMLYDFDNVKATFHVITSLYMLYMFEEAMCSITVGLMAHPDFKELKLMREKVLRNKILEKFSNKIIEERIAKYFQDKPNHSDDIHFVDVELLKQYVQDNRKSATLKEAHRVMAKMQHAADLLISLKNYRYANQMLIDMLYIINMLEKQFNERVGDRKMYYLYSNKATCLYYMERYKEATECSNKAKIYRNDTVEVLTLDAKILSKLNKFDEALEVINKCIRIVDQDSVEAVICEEILFEINFKRDMQNHPASTQSEDSKVTSDHSTGKDKATQDEANCQEVASEMKTDHIKNTTTSEPKKKVGQTPRRDEHLLMICRLCGVVVSTPWNEHIGTGEHQNLLSGKETKDLSSGSIGADASTQTDYSEDSN